MSKKNLLTAILGGAAIGAAVGLLLAPQSGKETRQKIRKAGNMSAEQLNELVAQGKNSWYDLKGKAKEGAGVAANEVDDFISHILKNGKTWWKAAKNKASDMAEEAGDAAKSGANKVGNYVDRTAEKATTYAERGSDYVKNAANKVENTVDHAANQAKQSANDLKDRVS
ncbi:MAG: YtxH domain-containing protein [Saprospiraceae bacterium]